MPGKHAQRGLMLMLGVVGLAGCRGSPLNQEETRTQYDKYDLLRAQWAEPYTEDKLGNRVPNLRGRLLPRP